MVLTPAYAVPDPDPMMEAFGHLLGPLAILLFEQLETLPPLYSEPFGNQTKNLVTIGCFVAPSFCHVKFVVSFTPCGCLGVPALLGVTVAFTCTAGDCMAAIATPAPASIATVTAAAASFRI